MVDLLLTPASISYLTQFIMALAVTGYFFYRLRPAPRLVYRTQTALLTGFFAAIALLSLLLFLEASLLWGQASYALFLQTIVSSISLVLLLQFTYHFPSLSPGQKWEARLVLGLSVLYALWELQLGVSRFGTLRNTGQIVYRPQLADYPLLLGFLWAMVMFLRQTVGASAAGNKQRSVWQHLWQPQGRMAHSARALALVYLIPVGLAVINLLQAYYLVSEVILNFSLSLGILIALAAFAVTYLNHLPETTSFVIKLAGVTLMVLLTILGTVGWVITPAYASTYQPALPDRRTIGFTPNGRGGYDVTLVPMRFESNLGAKLELNEQQENQSIELAFEFPYYGQKYQKIYVSGNGAISLGQDVGSGFFNYYYANGVPAIFPLLLDLNPASGGVYARREADRLVVTWNQVPSFHQPDARFTVQVTLYHSGIFKITYQGLPQKLAYNPNEGPGVNPWIVGAVPGGLEQWPQMADFTDLPLQDDGRGLVQDYQLEFRQYLHRLLAPLAYLIIAATLLVGIGFPLLFYTNLVRPLKALLAAVQQMNEGRYDINLKVQYPDEIGFLTQSFNDLSAELGALIQNLETRVSQRTTALRQSEQALRASEEKYHQLFELGSDAVFLIDNKTGQILDVNAAASALYGYSRDELLQMRNVDLSAEPDQTRRAMQQFQTTIPVRYHRKKDGQSLPVEITATHFTWQGQTAHIAAIRDISERLQAEEMLHQAKETAEAASHAKSAFLANMSHELRTPLHVILGFTQLMARSPTFPPEHHPNLNLITTSGEHLLTLINQVLDLSKIEAGRMSLDPKPFNLYQMLDQLEGMFQLRAGEKKLRLIFDRLPSTPRHVCADPIKLRQVLINLLGNALKFTEHGHVSLRVEGRKQYSESNLQPSTFNLHFSISDTGPGMTPAELDTIFEAFAQTETGRLTHEGTGLGLAICQKFVHLMGGEIEAESEPGQGTIFRFAVPVEPLESPQASSPVAPNQGVRLQPDQPHYRILVVDDDPANRQLFHKLLSPLGFDLQEAENGQQALDIWQAWQPHFIWMDLRMPLLDGYEATRRIKASPDGEQTVIVALSATHTPAEQVATAMSHGFHDFISKPFLDTEIFEMLHKHLGVQFIFQAIENAEPQPPQPEALLPADLAGLPLNLLQNLDRAVIEGDVERISALIEQLAPQKPAVAQTLSALATSMSIAV
ncbi:MAG: response regulator [Anaerolineales bacterium]|nr:response regulator [Anaerolineales bacterium]